MSSKRPAPAPGIARLEKRLNAMHAGKLRLYEVYVQHGRRHDSNVYVVARDVPEARRLARAVADDEGQAYGRVTDTIVQRLTAEHIVDSYANMTGIRQLMDLLEAVKAETGAYVYSSGT